MDPQRIAINQLIGNMTRLLQRLLGEGVNIVLELTPEAWSAIADPMQLQTALINLATNGRDAMPNGGQLIIGTKNIGLDRTIVERNIDLGPGEYVMVTVTDTGQGMSAET